MLYENRTNGWAEDIASAIGYTATCTLIEWYGGTRLWVPGVADASHIIGRVIGQAAFRALVATFGNSQLRIPTDYFRELVKQDRIVARMIQNGSGATEISAVIGMTPRQVQNIRRRLEECGILSQEPIVELSGMGQEALS